ncbi:MAG: hypothetical protein IKH86_03840 [Prevotella sp.]|nr:hypothetical protein [Prevotella sp.]
MRKQTFLKRHLQSIGWALVTTGTILLLAAWLTGLTTINAVLLVGLLLIVLGVFLCVKAIKNASNY